MSEGEDVVYRTRLVSSGMKQPCPLLGFVVSLTGNYRPSQGVEIGRRVGHSHGPSALLFYGIGGLSVFP